jgi:hypothetical protein
MLNKNDSSPVFPIVCAAMIIGTLTIPFTHKSASQSHSNSDPFAAYDRFEECMYGSSRNPLNTPSSFEQILACKSRFDSEMNER